MSREIKGEPKNLTEALYLFDRGQLKVPGARTRDDAVARLREQYDGRATRKASDKDSPRAGATTAPEAPDQTEELDEEHDGDEGTLTDEPRTTEATDDEAGDDGDEDGTDEDDDDDFDDEDEDDYDDWKKAELQKELKNRGLDQKGNVGTLIARLREDDASDSGE